jgi:copper homeostasis protein (lipoprotein)
MADAASFVECSTGRRWPVAGEGAARDLESAYLKVRSSAGATVLVEIEGAVLLRPRMEGAGTQPTLVVDKVGRLLPRESCAPRFTSAPLADTDWRLTHLGGQAIPAGDPKREPSLTFQAPTATSAGAYSGSTGCNRLIGTYAVANATITMTAAGTMMACKDAAATETAFIATLKATTTYRISGRVLELMDAKGATLARFEARMPAGITVR